MHPKRGLGEHVVLHGETAPAAMKTSNTRPFSFAYALVMLILTGVLLNPEAELTPRLSHDEAH